MIHRLRFRLIEALMFLAHSLLQKREASPRGRRLALWERPMIGRLRGDPAPRRKSVPPVPRPVCGRFRPTSDPGRWSCSAPSRRETKAIPPSCALPCADHRSGRTTLSSVGPVQDLELFDSLFLPFPPAQAQAVPFPQGVVSVPLLDTLLAAS